MTRIRRRTFGSYSGPQILGTEPFLLDIASSSHWNRVLYLTSLVESGAKFGSITMYDGTAVTAGLHQAIAVYPKELDSEDFYAEDDQGSFWNLLRKLELVPELREYSLVSSLLKKENWYLAQDSFLRYLTDSEVLLKRKKVKVKAGDVVFGSSIRDCFTPNGGRVPTSGPLWEKSSSWALAFHRLFSNPRTFPAQIQFGASHFSHLSSTRKVGNSTVSSILYGDRSLSSSYDLALSVFWSHSVNAPSIAFRILRECLDSSGDTGDQEKFARTLLRKLALSTYGRWHWTTKNGRWQRTRKFAMKMWDHSLFSRTGIMPSSL